MRLMDVELSSRLLELGAGSFSFSPSLDSRSSASRALFVLMISRGSKWTPPAFAVLDHWLVQSTVKTTNRIHHAQMMPKFHQTVDDEYDSDLRYCSPVSLVAPIGAPPIPEQAA